MHSRPTALHGLKAVSKYLPTIINFIRRKVEKEKYSYVHTTYINNVFGRRKAHGEPQVATVKTYSFTYSGTYLLS